MLHEVLPSRAWDSCLGLVDLDEQRWVSLWEALSKSRLFARTDTARHKYTRASNPQPPTHDFGHPQPQLYQEIKTSNSRRWRGFPGDMWPKRAIPPTRARETGGVWDTTAPRNQPSTPPASQPQPRGGIRLSLKHGLLGPVAESAPAHLEVNTIL